MPKFYATTPIYYVNDRPHIGHVYTTTVADVVCRYHRLRGCEVFFLTGTDEHAAKVVDAARERHITAQQWADQNAAAFQETFTRLGMSNDDFIRTSQPRHKDRVARYVAELIASGDVYLGEYEGWYDAGQEEYVPESKAKEYNFKSPINGKPLVRKREKNYFFKLSQYRQPLLDHIASNPKFVQPDARRNEIIQRIKDAEDVPISRTGMQGWGITVPGSENFDEPQTIYVWIDALFNYLTTVDTDDRRPYWPADIHFIAKDILWFHACIWPAVLLALQKRPGYQWVQLPRQIYAHSFWISEGQKMSKSLGNFIDLEKINHYVENFSLDALRYFLASSGPLGTTDSDFSDSKFIDVYNSDLANTLGNCFSRISNMTARYFDGKLPAHGPQVPASASYSEVATRCVAAYHAAMATTDLHAACEAALELVRAVDNYIEQTQPFKLAKDPANLPQVGTILYNCAEAIRIASLLLWPVMPDKMQELWARLGCAHYTQALAENRGNLNEWTTWGQLEAATPIDKGDALFPRFQPAKA
jgi:methionyl-tRNA synthetase